MFLETNILGLGIALTSVNQTTMYSLGHVITTISDVTAQVAIDYSHPLSSIVSISASPAHASDCHCCTCNLLTCQQVSLFYRWN